MSSPGETVEQTGRGGEHPVPAHPGAIVLLDGGQPCLRVLEVPRSGLEVGRGRPDGVLESDDRVSRRHLALRSLRNCWAVTDLESRNGTFANGERVQRYAEFEGQVLLRLGDSLIWAVSDVGPYLPAPPPPSPGGPVIGALLRRTWQQIQAASRAGDTLLIRGESGSGKELAARHLHETCFGTRSSAPFIAVNCAAIPAGLAERLLFGAKRGAYSGADADAQGYIAAADGGTLFLDELAELDLLVQAKLLRVLETGEVLPLGDSRPRTVRLRVCAATHADLREAVSAGRFRQDLYFRLGRPEVVLPPLRERIDELPWLIHAELQRHRPECKLSASFVEACAARHWPGNVRELIREVRLGMHGMPRNASTLLAQHLAADAGKSLEPARSADPPPVDASSRNEREIESALSEHHGNVTRAARTLGLHRNQLRRWLAKRPGQ
jgi:transcriptional regulator of acetoin/glycerol metabolism